MNHNNAREIPYPEGRFIRFLKNTVRRRIHTPVENDSFPLILSIKNVTIHKEASEHQRALFKEILDIPHVWIYLHGSRADNTATSFSDYDDLIIIDLEEEDTPNRTSLAKKLIRVDRRFNRLDPLQHHGHWIISKQSLENYDASYIPLSVLHAAVRVQGPARITYRLNESRTRAGLRRNIAQTCDVIRILYSLYEKNHINVYRLKMLVGAFVLMPAYLFQYRGEEVDKKTGIMRAGELFGAHALKCLEWSTSYRNSWNLLLDTAVHIRYMRRLISFVPIPHVYRKIAERFSPIPDLKKIPLPTLERAAVSAFIDKSMSHIQ